MKLVIFAGTSEGRTLCTRLSQAGMQATVCVATEYGKEVMPELPGITVHTGRMTAEEMADFLRETQLVVDATHPYAVEVSKNIRQACEMANCRYIRLLRPKTQAAHVVHVASTAAAAIKGRMDSFIFMVRSPLFPSYVSNDAFLYKIILLI